MLLLYLVIASVVCESNIYEDKNGIHFNASRIWIQETDVLQKIDTLLHETREQLNQLPETLTLTTSKIIHSTLDKAYLIVAEDFNNDGSIDFIVSHDAGLRLFINQGPENPLEFTKFTVKGSPSDISGLKSIDLNGDAFPDLAATLPREKQDFLFFIKNINGTHFGLPSAIVTADSDSDNFRDLAIGHFFEESAFSDIVVASRGSLAVYLTNGSDVLQKQVISTSSASTTTVIAADFDGDGLSDVMFASSESSMLTAYYLPSMQAVRSENVASIDNVVTMTTADFDQDGRVDVIGADLALHVIFMLTRAADGTWTRTTLADARAVTKLVAADMDGDGDMDVVFTSVSKIAWMRNTEGVFELMKPIAVFDEEVAHYQVEVADLDGDGDLDVISTSYFGQDVVIYVNDEFFPTDLAES